MADTNSKCFVLSVGGYEEITYAELCRRRENDESYVTKFFIPLHGMLMEVTKEQYKEFYKEKRRQKYLIERSISNGDISIDVLLSGGVKCVDLIADSIIDVAVIAVNRIQLNELRNAIRLLDNDEQILIYRYYYDEMTEAELAQIYGISQQAVSKRIRKVREKLRMMVEG